MSHDLEKAFDYYLEHQDELVSQYNGKYIVIKDKEIILVAESELEAITEASKENDLGTFLVQYVSPGNTAYTQSFHSRVAFN